METAVSNVLPDDWVSYHTAGTCQKGDLSRARCIIKHSWRKD